VHAGSQGADLGARHSVDARVAFAKPEQPLSRDW
jgi:hypothetical protein